MNWDKMNNPPPPGRRRKAQTPQGDVNKFWSEFSRKRPSKVTSIFPRLLYASLLPPHPDPRGASWARNAAESYDIAAKECRDKVRRIREECERTNEKFTDPDFDIETDFVLRDTNSWGLNCLLGLHLAPPPRPQVPDYDDSVRSTALSGGPRSYYQPRTVPPLPGSVHRLDWVFRNPQFTVNGFSHTDVQQGEVGDCWLLAAISTIAHRRDLMDRICVDRDEECGVYGFVFQRDGEWISTVVDDNLYLTSRDYRELYPEEFDPDGSRAARFRSLKQRGSEALLFSRCTDQNETWLPLLEKAFAKAHGDYQAISLGYVGDGVEDMTGGVTTPIATNKVLRKERLWRELSSSGGQFVFGLSALSRSERIEADSGVALGHAYSILRAVEVDTEDGKGSVRLVKVRNPWGKRDVKGRIGEWNGRWSDGSEEWTPYWMEKLDHRFKDDGIFWMGYDDLLQTYSYIYRTRLFDEQWTVIQQWATFNVSWVTGYLRTSFILDVKKAGMVVIVMAQLDTRYFRGLEGRYQFNLHFILREKGSQLGEYICRVRPVATDRDRSVSCEIDLEEGQYEVVPQITAESTGKQAVENLVPAYANLNPQKLRQVGLQYDLAHAKGGIPDEDRKIEHAKSKPREKPQTGRHHARIRSKAEFGVDLKSPQEPKPSDESGGSSVGQAEPKELRDTTGGPPTIGGLGHPCGDQEEDINGGPGNQAREKLTGDIDHKERGTGEREHGEHNGGPGRRDKPTGVNGNTFGAEMEPGKTHAIDRHADAESVDGHPDSDSEEDDNGEWNAVCVACLRVYSRDPDLTIALDDPEETQGGSNLMSGLEPAGATM